MLVPQTFGFADFGVLGLLVLLEGLLSADNALILAIMVRHLPSAQRRQALTYGLVGAFVFRAIAILGAAFILSMWWLEMIGAFYLLYLPLKHFRSVHRGSHRRANETGLWGTVLRVELADIAFALDSILAGVAMVHDPAKVWVVYVGGVLGMVLLRFAAQLFIRLFDRYPLFDHLAYVLVGWTGVKLLFASLHSLTLSLKSPDPIEPMSPLVFWSAMLAIIATGAILATRRPRTTLVEDEEPSSSPQDS